MRRDIERRLKKLEDAHGGKRTPEPDDDDAVRIWKFLLAKRRMDEERGERSGSPPPTLEWVRECITRKMKAEL